MIRRLRARRRARLIALRRAALLSALERSEGVATAAAWLDERKGNRP